MILKRLVSGYYMYIESTSRRENDSARLISPLYGGNLSKNSCFVFYYHMYGKSTGSLRVYVHPENVEFKKVMDDTTLAYKRFERNGNQGNIWLRGYFDLVPMVSNFQVRNRHEIYISQFFIYLYIK